MGVDCGTSKVAVALVNAAGDQLHVTSRPHAADLPSSVGHHEQDAERIIATAEDLVRGIDAEMRARIAGIGFTGQMHGVVLHDVAGTPLSPLVTWQDRRLEQDSACLPSPEHGARAGFALATLAWFARRGQLPIDARAATIHGLLAARWGAMARAPIDPTDVHAWGGLTPPPGIEAVRLPAVVRHGAPVGRLSAATAARLGLARGMTLYAPLGDNQASVRATLVSPTHDLGLTIGTGCQLSALVPRSLAVELGHAERRPYDAQHDLIVTAPLCGGAAWRWLAETVTEWMTDLGQSAIALEVMYARLDELGLLADDALSFAPHLLGERHDRSLTGALTGLRLGNGSLGRIARAVARSITANARNLMPVAIRQNRTRVIASGNALRHSELLRTMAEHELGLPLRLSDRSEEAATGAALVAASARNQSTWPAGLSHWPSNPE